MEPVKKSVIDTTLTRRDFLRAGIGGISAALLMNDAGAQTNARLSPEKAAVVEQLRKELGNMLVRCPGDDTPTQADRKQQIEKSLNTVDPILVGKNIVFDVKWLEFIGPGKALSQQQFEAWRDRIDKVYNSYVELMGGTPRYGTKVLIDLQPRGSFVSTSNSAHAHTVRNLICFNKNYFQFQRILSDVAKHNSTDMTMMHELAHIFEANQMWSISREAILEPIMAFAMEHNRDIHYGSGSASQPLSWRPTKGDQHRMNRYNLAVEQYKKGTIKYYASAAGNHSNRDAVDLYLLGLVDKVGWDTYKKTFRSYTDKSFKPNIYTYEGTKDEKISDLPLRIRARDFFDRIEHFSGKPGVLRTLPDRGELLDRFFSPKVIEQNLKPISNNTEIIR